MTKQQTFNFGLTEEMILVYRYVKRECILLDKRFSETMQATTIHIIHHRKRYIKMIFWGTVKVSIWYMFGTDTDALAIQIALLLIKAKLKKKFTKNG